MCYSLRYNGPSLLPAGSLEAEEVPPLPGYRPATAWVHYTESCNTQSSAPEDGRDQRPKHDELIGIINKPLLLHLFGVYIIYILSLLKTKFHYFHLDQVFLEIISCFSFLVLHFTTFSGCPCFDSKLRITFIRMLPECTVCQARRSHLKMLVARRVA